METKHTKANGNGNTWEVAEHLTSHGYKIVVHAHPKRVALCYLDGKGALYPNKSESMANAKLIAAAPELLDALILANRLITGYIPALSDDHMKIKNAINKATK